MHNMVLGRLRTKKRKGHKILVEYIVHVNQIDPWHPSQSQRTVESVLLHWENGYKSSGSLIADVTDGKIEFSDSFKLPVTLTKEASKKSTTGESFQKNCLEFTVYEYRKEKSMKSHHLASATINLADYGLIEEMIAISAPVTWKKSSKNAVQPVLYVNIEQFDNGSVSSPKGSKATLDQDGSEFASETVDEENDEDDAAYYTDDDNASVQSSQITTSSTSETTKDSRYQYDKKQIETVKDRRDTVNVEPALPSRGAHSYSSENTVAEPVKHLNDSEIRNRTESDKDSKMKVNREPDVSSGAPFFDAEQNPVVEPYQNKSKVHNRTESKQNTQTNMELPLASKAAFGNSDKKPVAEPFRDPNKSETQNRKESAKDSTKTVNIEPAVPSGPTFANSDKNTVAQPFSHRNKSKVHYRSESAMDSTNRIHEDLPPSSGSSFSISEKTPVAESFEYQDCSSSPTSSVDLSTFRKIAERRKRVSDGVAGFRATSTQQSNRDSATGSLAAKGGVDMNSDVARSSVSQINQEDDTRAGRQRKHSQDKTTTSFSTMDPANKNKMDLPKEGQREHDMEVKEHRPEDKPLSDISHSTRKKVSFRNGTLTSSKNEDQGSFVPNDKIKPVSSLQLPFDSAKTNDARDGSVSPTATEMKGIRNGLSGSKVELESKIEMLEEELMEAAAVEVALYSVVAEHGNSVNKLHAPARRLSRFYFHACKARSRSMRASAARTSISGLILVSKACGNDVPRLTFWLSNSIVLRATVSQASRDLSNSAELDINNDKFSPRSHESSCNRGKNNATDCFEEWENIQTFIAALEKVEAWIFSRIVESVWWQTLTPHMQSAAAKNASARKTVGKKHGFGDPEQVNFSIDLWKSAFKDACERLCPLRAVGLECGCLTVLARLVMEQLVNRLDVAMFNAILRNSAEDMPTDPMSDPISDSKVLPVPAGNTSFGAGAQLKNSIGEWSRWLTDLFGIDDDPSEDYTEYIVDNRHEYRPSFKPFNLLNSLCDLLMLPFNMITDKPTRNEVCPNFGAPLIKRIFDSFVPDEFCPDQVPQSVLDELDSAALSEAEGEYLTSVPCNAAPIVYSPPQEASLTGIIEVGTHSPSGRGGPLLLRISYTSDDELDELDSPIQTISVDNILVNPSSPTFNSRSKRKGRPKPVRYQLLREVWKDET